MKACKVPCNRCPFVKKSLPGFLGGYSTVGLHLLVMSEQPFPCHQTLPDIEEIRGDQALDYPLCAGALAYMDKNGKHPRDRALAALVKEAGAVSREAVLTIGEFMEHHKNNPVKEKG